MTDKQLRSILPFRGLSQFVCLSVSCIVLKCHKRSTQPHVSPRQRYITSVNPFYPKFCTEWPTPVDLSVGDISRQIAPKWLEIAQWSRWTAFSIPHRICKWYHQWPPTRLRPLFPKMGSQMHPSGTNSRRVLVNRIEDIDEISFAYEDVAFGHC